MIFASKICNLTPTFGDLGESVFEKVYKLDNRAEAYKNYKPVGSFPHQNPFTDEFQKILYEVQTVSSMIFRANKQNWLCIFGTCPRLWVMYVSSSVPMTLVAPPCLLTSTSSKQNSQLSQLLCGASGFIHNPCSAQLPSSWVRTLPLCWAVNHRWTC